MVFSLVAVGVSAYALSSPRPAAVKTATVHTQFIDREFVTRVDQIFLRCTYHNSDGTKMVRESLVDRIRLLVDHVNPECDRRFLR